MRSIMTSLLVLCSVVGLWAQGPAANIQNKRVALFYDEQFPWAGPVKPLAWYTNTLAELGLDVRLVNAMELSDEKLIARRNFDTVFMPDGRSFPLKAEYTLTAFLAEGGNLVVGELQEEVKAYDEQKGKWSRSYLQDWYSKFSEWQLRRNKPAQFKRSLNVPLTRNAQLPAALQSLLPAAVGPFSVKNDDAFQMLDRINANGEGGPGKDVNLASNIIWPLYALPNGEGADFVGYRHHNLLLNGSTLVLLGKTGRNLLKTEAAGGVLAAAFKVCELPFPGEQSAGYYKCLFEVQRGISRLSEQYVAVDAALADAAMAAFYQGQTERYNELKGQLSQVDRDFFALLSDGRQADTLLLAEQDFARQDQIRQDVLKRIAKQEKQFAALLKGLRPEIKAIRRPDQVAVTNRSFDSIRVDASMTAPIGLYMYRTRFFQAMKIIGANTVACGTMGNDSRRIREYLRDPQVLKASEGVAFMPVFNAGGWNYSKFEPVTGVIKETKDGDHPLDNTAIAKEMPEFIAEWKDMPVYRFYHGDALMGENAIGTLYWGMQARKDYQAYLAKQYATIQALNRRWQAQFKSFDEIPAPMGQPQTEAEHGNWEDWSVFRDNIYLQKMKFIYDLSKSLAPSIPVSSVMSISAFLRPYFGGNNHYQYTKYQDISGMDGTYLDVPVGEWTWFDLNRGIPHYTVEWGPYYVPKSDPKQWKNKFTEEVWALLSGGGIGINCRVWSYGGCSGNSVDTMGLPTLGGWTLKRMIEQVNQFDQIILDGKRPASVRILFSNTCRRHDQGWSGGSASRHRNAVDNLYHLFRTWHWPARVLAEEALAESNNMADCKLLLAPQAEYLKESTQKQLLDFVQRGGTLLVEGYSGRLDNYGQASGVLFAAAKVKCLPAERAVLVLDGQELPLGDSEATYRLEAEPAANVHVLLQYADRSAAVLSCPMGKGRLIFSGLPLGLLKMDAEGRRIMEIAGQDAGVTPKYRCKNSNLVMREWEYAGHTWLVCTYPYLHDQGLQECALTIGGPCKVQDYLLGMDLPSQTDGKDTVVRFVMPVPGIRVLRLDPLSAQEVAQIKTVASLGDVPADRTADANAPQPHMPYKGFLYEGRPVEVDGYKIDVMVIGRGEADLTIRKGTETVRRRINADTATQFGTIDRARQFSMVVGGNTLTIYSLAISDILPVGANLEIHMTKGVVSKESACSFNDSGDRLILQNGIIQIEVNAKVGGRVMSFAAEKDGINQVAGDKGLKVGITERIWGVFSQSPYTFDVVSNNTQSVAVCLKARDKMGDLDLAKRIEMARGVAAWTLIVEANQPGNPARKSLLNLHPQLTVGGSADFYDNLYVPVAGGVTNLAYRSSAGGSDFITPSQGWAGVVDRKQKVALIEQFPPDEKRIIYFWMGADFCALERFSTAVTNVAAGQTEAMYTRFLLVPGMTALDAVTNDLAVALDVSAASSQPEQDLSAMVEVGSAQAAERPVRIELALMKDGAKAADIGKWEGIVSYDKPVNHSFPLSRKSLAEAGQYTIKLILSDPKGGILADVEKKCDGVR